ncbi:lactate utilization protein [Acidisoma cellulosilytica]|uniref:Lactate utilization protein n=1 Tax=Acidisoma cellulosilyticum TaxID=2802395 RepID=A0A963YYY2_9PROT|nr:lactate utilization protein B [Acidisoma cellulosilyticum]MCB8878967.1 lactate utilization protein [Acidisoma cellulosilyticum]
MSAGTDKTKPVDHAGAAAAFVADTPHLAFHDRRLWELRQKRDGQMHVIPEWQELRSLASAIKEHTLSRLADYLEQFEAQAKARGVTVHWARNAEEHNATVLRIMREHKAKTLAKSKSMLTEECEMAPFLERHGITITETDLGERIQQLDGQAPSHIVVPAVHKLREDVARVFARTIGGDPNNADPNALAEHARVTTRPLMLDADIGMTGANFLVAETGAVVVCTNEGNADLSANIPKVHIVSAGIEKLIPRQADLGVFIRLLSRSALGSPITQYTSHFRGPRAGAEMHIILVDNGRSQRLGEEDFWPSLKCIRCGACMNTCPVYRRSGGLSYGAVYSGPIGAIINPSYDPMRYSTLPFASTLNGSCTSVCPVKINIHDQLYKWRRVIAERGLLPKNKALSLRIAGYVLASPRLYRLATGAARMAVRHLPRALLYSKLNSWGRDREVPAAPKESFAAWAARNRPVKR